MADLVAKLGLETDLCSRTRCSSYRFGDWSRVPPDDCPLMFANQPSLSKVCVTSLPAG
jgi:hypothetical protein